ncbi:hypothetical protein TNCV_3998871 [Trichonephila clavipes]|nr:hypothetical protein TNCV_3998871 [Trichonephila clavipes]
MNDISPLSDPINTDSTRIYSDNDGDEDVNMYIDEYVDKNIDKDGDENAINIDECRNEDVSNIDEFREVGPVIMSNDYKELETISKARYDEKSTCNGNELSDSFVQRDNKTCI